MLKTQVSQVGKARRTWRGFAVVVPLVISCGCSSMSNTDKGVATGGLLGAGAGTLIGAATHHTALGAVAGAGIGAVAGGLTGNAIDKSEAKTQAQVSQVAAEQQAQIQAQQIGIADVARMAQQHISDELIINQIRTSGSVYRLTADDITFLKSNGVSDVVVMEMQATANRPMRRVYTAVPVYPQPVYVEPAPVVGVGFAGRFR